MKNVLSYGYHKDKMEKKSIKYSQLWMNLEPVIQSEVSQKEKSKYHILTHVYGI